MKQRRNISQVANFLATDEVPETIFGIPVITKETGYTKKDIAFFREHPEAGGYYDMGDDGADDSHTGNTASGAGTALADPVVEFAAANPTLFSHVKRFEKLRLAPYPDIGGHAIGYGAHTDESGNRVTASTPRLADDAAATRLLSRDLFVRRNRLAGMLPGWNRLPGSAKQALLDVSMGKDDILDESRSAGLWRDLRAAGTDREKLLGVVKKHYTSYLTNDEKHRSGLMERRIAGMKTFFGEDWSYEGKEWDGERGFVTKGAK